MNFLKKLFGKNKAEETNEIEHFVVATLNDRILPINRGIVYEDPLDEFIQEEGIGEVTGGGTMQFKNGEVDYCDLEILLNNSETDRDQINAIIQKLESLGAPKGSKLLIESTEETIEFGVTEGLAIYLDGINLATEVYENCDSDFVISEIKRLIGDSSEVDRFWEGESETALYFYAASFDEMKAAIHDFISVYPLCEGARVERIA